jgi:hypothetical protein
MKRIGVLVLLGLLALILNTRSVSALPAFNKQFLATYEKSKIIDDAKKAKCNVCHYGKSKKNRNDYGTALSKFVTKDDYKKLKDDKPALKKKIEDAFKSAEKEKSVSGTEFGKLMEDGKLPGTEPEEEEG